MKYDTIVIGSGISGLTSALIAAKEGRKVALFERDRELAPLLRPYWRKGCCFSPGLHTNGWMDRRETFACLFHYLGVADGVEQVVHEGGFGNVVIGSKRYHIPRGFEAIETALQAYFPEDQIAIHHYIQTVKQINEQLFYFNLRPEFGKLKFPVELQKAEDSLQGYLKLYRASDALIELLGTMNQIMTGSRVDEAPFKAHAIAWGGFFQSPGYFTVAGIIRLLANFKRELTAFGVDFYLDTEVAEIVTGPGRKVVGVKTQKGELFLGEAVIATFHPQLLLEKIQPGALRPIYRQRLEEAENSFGFYAAFYKIVDCPRLEIENLIYYNKEHDLKLTLNLNYWEGQPVLGVFLADPHPATAEDGMERARRAGLMLEKLEAAVECQIPELKTKLRLLDYLKPWSFERYTQTIHGSAYGLKQSIHFPEFHYRVPIKGLYLAGQSLHSCFLGALISSIGLACELNGGERFWTKVIEKWN